MGKGYSISMDIRGRVIKSIQGLEKGDKVNVILSDGSLENTIKSINKGAYIGREKETT